MDKTSMILERLVCALGRKKKKNINGLGLLKKTPGKVITAMAALMVVKLTPVLSAMGGDEPQKEA